MDTPTIHGAYACACMSMAWDSVALRESPVFITLPSSTWVRQVGERLPDADAPWAIPEVGELDEWETFVGSKSGATPRRCTALGNAHQDKKL